MAEAVIGHGDIMHAPLPIYILGSVGDYSLPPKYSHELIEKWNALALQCAAEFQRSGQIP